MPNALAAARPPARPRRGRAAQAVALIVLLAPAATAGSLLLAARRPPAAEAATPPSIATLLGGRGDRVVTIDGRYRGGTVRAPHPRTNGPYKGWLVVRAARRGSAVVDLSKGPLVLEAGTSRVAFLGIRFVNGSVDVRGSDVLFWYTDHSFPAEVWARQAPDPRYPERDGVYKAPRTLYLNSPTTKRVTFYGANIHNTGTGALISRSTSVKFVGVHMWDFSDQGLDPQDVLHPDAIGGAAGASTRLLVNKSHIEGRIMLTDAPKPYGSLSRDPGVGGPHRDLVFGNSWFRGSPSAGFVFTSRKPTAPRGIFGSRWRIRSFGHNGLDRIEFIDGRKHFEPNRVPDRIHVGDEHVDRSTPPPGLRTPAGLWRDAHTYDKWRGALS
jgi:hypothetical protein